MSQKNVAALPLAGNPVALPSGAVVQFVTVAVEPIFVTSKQLSEETGIPRETIQATLEDLGVEHEPSGKQRIYKRADLRAVTFTKRAPVAAKLPKAPVVAKPNMTALDRARANGLVVVADEKAGK